MRGRWRWLALALWTVAAVAAGAWMARRGPFGWRHDSLAAVRASVSLAATTRERLRPRMRRHGEVMSELASAAMLLDHPRVIRAAGAIASDPQLARPLTSEAAALSAELPAPFHDFEDRLADNARALAAAAERDDDDALVAAEARLAWTCAACHAAFHGP